MAALPPPFDYYSSGDEESEHETDGSTENDAMDLSEDALNDNVSVEGMDGVMEAHDLLPSHSGCHNPDNDDESAGDSEDDPEWYGLLGNDDAYYDDIFVSDQTIYNAEDVEIMDIVSARRDERDSPVDVQPADNSTALVNNSFEDDEEMSDGSDGSQNGDAESGTEDEPTVGRIQRKRNQGGWMDPSKPPPVPRLTKRDSKRWRRKVEVLNQNCRVRIDPRTPTPIIPIAKKLWIAHPNDDEAKLGRKKGDPVFCFLVDREKGSPYFMYADAFGLLVGEDYIDFHVPQEGMKDLEQEILRSAYEEQAERVAKYERETEIYKRRNTYFLDCRPPAAADVAGYPTREQGQADIIAKVSLAKDEFENWKVWVLENGLGYFFCNSKRRELHKFRAKLIENNWSVNWLQQHVPNISMDIRPYEVIPNPFTRKERTIKSRDRVMVRDIQSTRTANEARDFARVAIANGKYGTPGLRGSSLMTMAMIAGWTKPDLVQNHPDLVLKCKKFWW